MARSQFDADLARSVEDAQDEGTRPDVSTMTLADLSALMQKAVTARSRVEEINATVRTEIERITMWGLDETAADDRFIAYVEGVAEAYLRRHLSMIDELGDKSGKRSVSTPWGDVTSVTRGPQPVVRDKDALHAWALLRGYVRERDPETDWASIKRNAKVAGSNLVMSLGPDRGERVPGVEVEDAGPSITVRLGKPS